MADAHATEFVWPKVTTVYREIARENSTHLEAFIIRGQSRYFNAGIGSRACRLHVYAKTVQPNIKFPVTSFLFFMHALCAHAQGSVDLHVESYGVAGPLVETLYSSLPNKSHVYWQFFHKGA